MIEKKTNKGSWYAVSGMMLMAHKLGVSAHSDLTETDIPEDIFEYEVVFRDPPIEDWSLDPNDMSAVNLNRKAVLFAIAIYNAARVSNAFEKEPDEEHAAHFIELLTEQHVQLINIVSDYLKWYSKEECDSSGLLHYLGKVFTKIAEESATHKLVEEITELLVERREIQCKLVISI